MESAGQTSHFWWGVFGSEKRVMEVFMNPSLSSYLWMEQNILPAAEQLPHSVDLLNLGPRTRPTATIILVHPFPTTTTTTTLIHLGYDRVTYSLNLLQFILQLVHLRQLVPVQPLHRLLHRLLYLLFIPCPQLLPKLLIPHRVPHIICVVLERVLRLNLLLRLLVLRLIPLRILHHLLYILLAQPPFVVRDRYLILHARRLILRHHIQYTVRIDVERHVDLRDTPGRRRDSGQLKFPEEVIVPRPRPLPLINLDEYTRLVIRVGRENLLLLSRDSRVPRDQNSHDTPSRLQTERKRRDVEQQKLLNFLVPFTRQNGRLHCGPVSDGLVRVDALAELLPVEEVLQKLLDFGYPGRPAHENHLVDEGLVDLGVPQALLHGLHALEEEVHAELLEPRARDRRVEVDPLEQRRAGAAADVLPVLAAELGHEVVDEAVVEVLPAEVGVPRGGLHLEDPFLDREDGDVERAAAEVKDEHVALAAVGGRGALVEAVGDGGGGGLVDDAEDVEASDGAGVLGGLALGVVEVGGDGDDGVLGWGPEEGLGGLAHLGEDHGGDFFRGELLAFVLVGDEDEGLVGGAGDDVLQQGLKVEIRNGRSTKLKDWNWVVNGPTKIKQGAVRTDVWVADLMTNEGRNWDERLVRGYFDEAESRQVLQINTLNPEAEDKWSVLMLYLLDFSSCGCLQCIWCVVV
ncbi:NAD-specific glutamate dehydrogenase [Striga asiatica]|uniref:NAD-specific glutamate dehydrogenase n=1 Tax=Striga asiatica TaxID=4170 RepID=A0A5A7R1M2_STRAF|nr:NAD-specific glutamate dehydrogenase [Striga asiatica]